MLIAKTCPRAEHDDMVATRMDESRQWATETEPRAPLVGVDRQRLGVEATGAWNHEINDGRRGQFELLPTNAAHILQLSLPRSAANPEPNPLSTTETAPRIHQRQDCPDAKGCTSGSTFQHWANQKAPSTAVGVECPEGRN